MSREAFERGDWQAVIDAHPLESHDAEEWLRYGVALLQTIQPGPEVGKQQQQAALAFVQAQKEGATADEVAGAQRQSVLLSLSQALGLAGLTEGADTVLTAEGQSLVVSWREAAPSSEIQDAEPRAVRDPSPREALQTLINALAQMHALDLPEQGSTLDQLLAAKGQLGDKGVAVATVVDGLSQEFPIGQQAWAAALQKALLVLH